MESARAIASHAGPHAGPRTGAAGPLPASAAGRALSRLVATEGDAGAAIARVTLGAVMLPHGLQKLVGAFGGPGFGATMAWLTGDVGAPYPLALLAVLAESLGPFALLAGLLGRVAACGIAGVMVGAVVTTHLPHGFFMDWEGARAGEGFEYHLLALGLAAVVAVRGSGALSLDRAASPAGRGR
jgi:putative oxidoreductase